MDEESIENIIPTITPEGVAGMWMHSRMPEGSRADQISLGRVIEDILSEGIRKGMTNALTILEVSPTISAAKATIEADRYELERAIRMKHEDGIDFDVWKA